ncbi:hypothetical protein [Crossiella sp. CA198]|uniref:hypothetical protein n=1 Tax=Crossiella sp. CA198 TaxID=3455607 RepID=UPI003F8D78C1
MNRTYPGPTFSLGANTFHAHTVDREEVFVPVDGPLTATADGVERVVAPSMALAIAPGELYRRAPALGPGVHERGHLGGAERSGVRAPVGAVRRQTMNPIA